jgi:UPF0716 family protein affecting phage T7 exclusion
MGVGVCGGMTVLLSTVAVLMLGIDVIGGMEVGGRVGAESTLALFLSGSVVGVSVGASDGVIGVSGFEPADCNEEG